MLKPRVLLLEEIPKLEKRNNASGVFSATQKRNGVHHEMQVKMMGIRMNGVNRLELAEESAENRSEGQQFIDCNLILFRGAKGEDIVIQARAAVFVPSSFQAIHTLDRIVWG